MSKFIFVTGGVLSSIGKGLTAASIGTLLEGMGYSVSFLKLDPYLNVDPGTMSPFQHGEVFVTQDGAETDLDLGHYERFTHANLHAYNSITSGKLYAQLIEKERRGDFLGGTIQIVPHLTDEIKAAINRVAQGVDCAIIEIGGTVGDIEGLPFIEAIRQMGLAQRKDCLFVHLTYVPYLEVAAELKTKPTQHSVKALCSLGIQPDVLICRSQLPMPEEIKKKISLFTNVDLSAIISAPDLKSVYELPLYLASEKLPECISRQLGITYNEPNLTVWREMVHTLQSLQDAVTIAIVGKYTGLKDAYKSLSEALIHAQIATKQKVKLVWIDAEEITSENVSQKLGCVQGIIVPGGFGNRGIEGKIAAVRYAREHKIPYLGICLGMQIAAIEFARDVLGLKDANSAEFDQSTKNPVVHLMESQKGVSGKGGTMRLGAQVCVLAPKSKVREIYGAEKISERHRHRYELNTAYVDQFKKAGLVVTGLHETQNLPEMIEIPAHPFFVACQFHPELQSKPYAPHPLFVAFVRACKVF